MSTRAQKPYLPAAGFDWLLPFYDPFTRLLGMETARRALCEQAGLQASYDVLDIGCGTGTLAIRIKQRDPGVRVTGLDPDAKALTRAARKAARAGVVIKLDRGFSGSLPYADSSFDRVFSSMMFHHLDSDEKERTLREVRRVLKPRGRLEMLDFSASAHGPHGWLARLFHEQKQLRDNQDDVILERMSSAGLSDAKIVGHRRRLFAHLTYFQASRAA